MAVAAILGFRNREILLAHGIQNAKTHHLSEFRQIGQSIAKIFRFFKLAAVHRHRLGFVRGHIWTTHREYLWISITLQNLVMIDAVVLII